MKLYLFRKWSAISPTFPPVTTTEQPVSAMALTCCSISCSSPLLNSSNSDADLSSTVPLVSVFMESKGHEYTAILASVALLTIPYKQTQGGGKGREGRERLLSGKEKHGCLMTLQHLNHKLTNVPNITKYNGGNIPNFSCCCFLFCFSEDDFRGQYLPSLNCGWQCTASLLPERDNIHLTLDLPLPWNNNGRPTIGNYS